MKHFRATFDQLKLKMALVPNKSAAWWKYRR